MPGSHLHTIQDWVQRGQRAQYHSAELAVQCQVSLSHLGRFFRTFFYRPPQHWLDELRLCDSTKLLVHGCSVKETAFQLSFADPSHFSHAFKRYYGIPPADFPALLRELSTKYPYAFNPPIWVQAHRALLSPLPHSRRNQLPRIF